MWLTVYINHGTRTTTQPLRALSLCTKVHDISNVITSTRQPMKCPSFTELPWLPAHYNIDFIKPRQGAAYRDVPPGKQRAENEGGKRAENPQLPGDN